MRLKMSLVDCALPWACRQHPDASSNSAAPLPLAEYSSLHTCDDERHASTIERSLSHWPHRLGAAELTAAITAADNMIAALADLRAHTKLRTLNLRGNALVSIAALPHHLPAALHTLDVANNDLGNLSDLRYASSLMELRRLDLRANPFTSMAHMQRIDYRPFVV